MTKPRLFSPFEGYLKWTEEVISLEPLQGWKISLLICHLHVHNMHKRWNMCVSVGLLRLNYLCDRLSVRTTRLYTEDIEDDHHTSTTQTGFPKRKIKATPSFPQMMNGVWKSVALLLRWAAICIQANILLLNKPQNPSLYVLWSHIVVHSVWLMSSAGYGHLRSIACRQYDVCVCALHWWVQAPSFWWGAVHNRRHVPVWRLLKMLSQILFMSVS